MSCPFLINIGWKEEKVVEMATDHNWSKAFLVLNALNDFSVFKTALTAENTKMVFIEKTGCAHLPMMDWTGITSI